MPRGDKGKYTEKQKRKAKHIAEGYEDRGVSKKETKSRAWATMNKQSTGERKVDRAGARKKATPHRERAERKAARRALRSRRSNHAHEEQKKIVTVRTLHQPALMALTVSLLITPAAYHRIVENGEDTEHFHKVAGIFLLAAMILLPLGICGDLFVVRMIVADASIAVICAGLMLVLFYGLWFGSTAHRRMQKS